MLNTLQTYLDEKLDYFTVKALAIKVIDFFGANLEMEGNTKHGKVSIYMAGDAYIKTIDYKGLDNNDKMTLVVITEERIRYNLEGGL